MIIHEDELIYKGTTFQKGDLVRTKYSRYSTLEPKQGRIRGFSSFKWEGEDIPEVIIDTGAGELHRTHPDNIEKIDESWMEMC